MLIFLFLFFFNFSPYGEKFFVQKSKDKDTKNSLIEKEITLGNKQKSEFKIKSSEQSDKDELVKKLYYLNRNLSKNHKARRSLNLRLAHILSLRAEENLVKAEKGKCKICKIQAQTDARRSLSIYKTLDPYLNKTHHSLLHTEILFKQAYLHRLLEEKRKAISKLKQIIKKKPVHSNLITRAWFNIGEIHFELYDYRRSLQAFNKVLEKKESPWKFKALYRKIWSLSNLSLYEESIEELESFLKSKLYSNTELNLEDRKLKQKLEKELITLYSYTKVIDKRLEFIYNFSKKDQNKNTLVEKNKRFFDLALALSRVGRINNSNKVWKRYIQKTSSLEKKLQAYVFLIDNDLILNKAYLLEEAGQKIERVFAFQEKITISQDFTKRIKHQAKKFFNQVGQKSFSNKQKKYLFTLYQKYNFIYQKDLDVLSRLANIARDLKKYALAQDLFQKIVLKFDSYQNKKILKKDIKENMSQAQLKMAELTKDKNRYLNAYDFYTQHGSRKDLIFRVQYKKAQIIYENKKYLKASELFKNLALDEENKSLSLFKNLRLKAARLSLSALDQLGNQEQKLSDWAHSFIKEFPKSRKEFVRIHHIALLNTVKKLVSNKDFSHQPLQSSVDENILKAWKTLQQLSLEEATKKEAFTYHFNKLLLAKELLRFESMKKSIQALLSNRDLKTEDRNVVLKWKLWLAELQFDFKEMLRIIKILQPNKLSEDHLFYLARLSELAGFSPIPYYENIIKTFPNSQLIVNIVTSMIEKLPTKDQKKRILKKYISFFKNHSDTLAYLILKIDEGQLEEAFIKFFTSLSFMKDSPLVSFVKRKNAIELFEKGLFNIVNYSLPIKPSGYKLKRALRTYTNKVVRLGNQSEQALKVQDWTTSVFVLFFWKKEISRFHRSIMNLPVPKGLTKGEQVQYRKLLQEQLQPYEIQITQLQKELDSLWSKKDLFLNYEKGFKKNSVFFAPLKWEMKKLLMVSDVKNKKYIEALLFSLKQESQEKTAIKDKSNETDHLYKILKKNPFDKKSLRKLLDLEKTNNNTNIVHYLTNRIKNLKKASQRI